MGILTVNEDSEVTTGHRMGILTVNEVSGVIKSHGDLECKKGSEVTQLMGILTVNEDSKVIKSHEMKTLK